MDGELAQGSVSWDPRRDHPAPASMGPGTLDKSHGLAEALMFKSQRKFVKIKEDNDVILLKKR